MSRIEDGWHIPKRFLFVCEVTSFCTALGPLLSSFTSTLTLCTPGSAGSTCALPAGSVQGAARRRQGRETARVEEEAGLGSYLSLPTHPSACGSWLARQFFPTTVSKCSVQLFPAQGIISFYVTPLETAVQVLVLSRKVRASTSSHSGTIFLQVVACRVIQPFLTTGSCFLQLLHLCDTSDFFF